MATKEEMREVALAKKRDYTRVILGISGAVFAVFLLCGILNATGQVDWSALLKACQEVGVKYYFIEDESPTVVQQIPKSLRFLEQVKF